MQSMPTSEYKALYRDFMREIIALHNGPESIACGFNGPPYKALKVLAEFYCSLLRGRGVRHIETPQNSFKTLLDGVRKYLSLFDVSPWMDIYIFSNENFPGYIQIGQDEDADKYYYSLVESGDYPGIRLEYRLTTRHACLMLPFMHALLADCCHSEQEKTYACHPNHAIRMALQSHSFLAGILCHSKSDKQASDLTI